MFQTKILLQMYPNSAVLFYSDFIFENVFIHQNALIDINEPKGKHKHICRSPKMYTNNYIKLR